MKYNNSHQQAKRKYNKKHYNYQINKPLTNNYYNEGYNVI